MTARVLVVDDEADIRTFLRVTLELAGYEVVEAADGRQALEVAISDSPDVVLLDVMMPEVDGFEVVRRLRENARTAHLPVILVTARSQAADKVTGLGAGADDYVTKPFDPDELLARVATTLRRATELRATSPLTGLPGNPRIEQELARRLDAGIPFALLYADLNDFKAYNDHYGFHRGDQVIRTLADVLVAVTSEVEDAFVGHVGGDDFVAVVRPEDAERVAEEVCRRFDAVAPELYDPEDRARGSIEVADRQGVARQFPLVSVSIGITRSEQRRFSHPSEVIAAATEMKSYAKRTRGEGSSWAVDRRRG